MSWKPEIKVYGDENFYQNGVTFATKEEAENSAMNLYGRWTLAEKYRAVEVSDEEHPVNYKHIEGIGDVPIVPVGIRVGNFPQ